MFSAVATCLLKDILKLPRTSVANLKYFACPDECTNYEKYDRRKLRIMEKVPQYASNLRPPKMQKKIRNMRGPENIHNEFLHRQYGIVASSGGRLRSGHFEMMRLTIGRKIDTNRMFAIWRVSPPWQPITKKGQGHRMGSGKGAIDHYVTPVKSGQVILEVGGKCEFKEVSPLLENVCKQLPFKAMPLSYELQQKHDCGNSNNLTMKYIVKNNLSGCHRFLSPVDHKWFGEH